MPFFILFFVWMTPPGFILLVFRSFMWQITQELLLLFRVYGLSCSNFYVSRVCSTQADCESDCGRHCRRQSCSMFSDTSSCLVLNRSGKFHPGGSQASGCVCEAVPTEPHCLDVVVKHTGSVHNLPGPQRPLVSTANGVWRKFTAAFKSAITSGVMGHCGRSRGGREQREDAASFLFYFF